MQESGVSKLVSVRLEDIKQYIESDTQFMNYLLENIEEKKYIDISDCSLFTDQKYCLKLLNL